MARFSRLDLAGGWYHVANRGAGRQRIFRNDDHRQLFVDLLGELEQLFQVEVHAYCLMSNRYDLVLYCHAPNLSRAMRHLGGVYTQRYNRLAGRDGPLFRGRFRSVLFDASECLHAVTRHLHRRPLVTGTVPRLDRYRWSSYPTFVTRRRQPQWLHTEAVLENDTAGSRRKYRLYVEQEGESNHLVRDFYRQSRPGNLLGDSAFLAQVQSLYGAGAKPPPTPRSPTPRRIMRLVAEHYQVPRRQLLTAVRGRLNEPRLAALWLCRRHCGITLDQLALQFGMAGYGSASACLYRIKTRMGKAFWRDIAALEKRLQAPSAGSV